MRSEVAEVVEVVLVACMHQEMHLVEIATVFGKTLLEIAVEDVNIPPVAIEYDGDLGFFHPPSGAWVFSFSWSFRWVVLESKKTPLLTGHAVQYSRGFTPTGARSESSAPVDSWPGLMRYKAERMAADVMSRTRATAQTRLQRVCCPLGAKKPARWQAVPGVMRECLVFVKEEGRLFLVSGGPRETFARKMATRERVKHVSIVLLSHGG